MRIILFRELKYILEHFSSDHVQLLCFDVYALLAIQIRVELRTKAKTRVSTSVKISPSV